MKTFLRLFSIFVLFVCLTFKVNASVQNYQLNVVDDNFELTWELDPDDTKYIIYECDSMDAESCSQISTTEENLYIVKNVEKGIKYFYGVGYCNNLGEEVCYAPIVLSKYILPEMGDITIKKTSKTSVNVSFANVSNATGYIISYNALNDDNIITVGTTNNSIDINDLDANLTYEISVNACFDDIGSNICTNLSTNKINMKNETPIITVSLQNFGNILISWNTIENAENYNIYRSTDNSKYSLLVTTEDTNYVDSNLKYNQKYYYKVCANEYGKCEEYSNVASSKSILSVPTITVNPKSYNSIKISYDKVDGATGYQIYRATSKNGKYSLIKTTSSLSYTNSSLTTGKTYYYKVRAYITISGKKYYSSYSKISSIIPKVSAPTFTVKSYDYNANKITITSVTGATGYQIYRSTNENGTYKLLTTTTKKSYIDSKLTTGKTYYYKVRAYRTVSRTKKYGYYSDVLTSVPTLKTPTFTINNKLSRNSLTLNITKVNGASGYDIYEVIGDDLIFIASITGTNYVVSGLELGTEHTYAVKAYKFVNDMKYESNTNEINAVVKPAILNLNVESISFDKQIIYSTIENTYADDTVKIYLYQSNSKDGEYSLIYEGDASYDEFENNLYFEYSNENLILNKTYYYKAIIEINGVKSEYSNIIYRKATQKLALTILDYSYGKVIIGSGDYTETMDGFQIYRSTSKNGTYSKVYDDILPITYISSNFNKNYYYKIRFYKIYDGKKVYSEWSSIKSFKQQLKGLDDYPITLDGDYSTEKVKSVSVSIRKTTTDYVYYNFKMNYSKTYSTKSHRVYYVVYFYDWQLNQVYSYNLYDTIPKGTKKNWSTTFEIKLPKGAVYFGFE